MGLHFIPDNTNFNFIGVRKIAYVISIIIVLVCIGFLVFSGGPKYGIDFAGGATVLVKFDKPITDEELKKSIAGAALPGLAIQQFGNDNTSYMLRITTVEETATGINKAVTDTLSTSLDGAGFEIQSLQMVGPKVGADLRAKAIQAIYIAILLTAVYISGRFENRWFTAGLMAAALGVSMLALEYYNVPKEFSVLAAILVTIAVCMKLRLVFALGTVISIVHDVVITIGLYCLMGKEIDLTIIAALLTMVGYSLNDTIIVYDRIRENLRSNRDKPLSTVINQSINQTLSRTMLTSGSTLLVILVLFFFGGSMLRDFAVIMIIGVVTGTLSSIFVASPILLIFGDRVVTHVEEIDTRPRDEDGRLAAQV